jgi:hypothetical protein
VRLCTRPEAVSGKGRPARDRSERTSARSGRAADGPLGQSGGALQQVATAMGVRRVIEHAAQREAPGVDRCSLTLSAWSPTA